jgi:tetratricopeptide (TPR) repeat protein
MSRARILLLCVVALGGAAAFVWSARGGQAARGPAPRSILDSPFTLTGLDTDKGIRQFETRVKEDPRDFLSLTILGQLYARKGRDGGDLTWLRRAEEAFRHALRLKPDHTPASAQLAAVYVSQHRFAEGLELARQVYAQSPNSLDALATLADAYLETGRYQEADDAIATLERAAGNDQGVLARRAFSAEVRGRTAQAVALLQKAIGLMEQQAETGREIAWFHARLGDLYFHSGCLSEADRAFQSALGLAEAYPLGLVGLADVRAIQGRLPEAADLYQKALAGTPVPRRLFQLAAIEERLNRTADAQRHRQEGEALARNPDGYPPAHYRDLAQFYAEQVGRAAEALDYAQKDMAQRQDVRAYDTLAWALYRNGRFKEAATAIGEALKYGTRDPDFYYHAGMIHEALGEKSRAQAAFDRALDLRPRAAGESAPPPCRLQS